VITETTEAKHRSNNIDTDLPPLPGPRDLDGARKGYDADDMRNHAVDAYMAGVIAEREWCANYLQGLANECQPNSLRRAVLEASAAVMRQRLAKARAFYEQ
jgi:uncharacterized protein YciW